MMRNTGRHQIYKLSRNWYGACSMCSRVLTRESQPGALFALEDHVKRDHMIWFSPAVREQTATSATLIG